MSIISVPSFIYLLVGAAAGYGLGRYRTHVFQNSGEAQVARELSSAFTAPDYHLMNHLTLPVKDATTQIDHVLVSRFGVFVVETKDYQGWIFGNPKHDKWTQVLYQHKFRFQNPLHQNELHVRVVQELLDFLPPGAVKSVVVFAGDGSFKTPMPDGVCLLQDLVPHIREHAVELLSLNRVQFCVGRLETARLAVTRTTDVKHVENLQRRFGAE